ncbi:hypothetical protein LTR10_000274 [Elasticomyces elasticus]|nr:hypothetical protein LTR10_000274 [Elasticomyces elasticus]
MHSPHGRWYKVRGTVSRFPSCSTPLAYPSSKYSHPLYLARRTEALKMSSYRTPRWVNGLSRDMYGTDVPTLQKEVEQLRRHIRREHEARVKKELDYVNLKRRLEEMRSSFKALFEAYERATRALESEKQRSRRVAYGR